MCSLHQRDLCSWLFNERDSVDEYWFRMCSTLVWPSGVAILSFCVAIKPFSHGYLVLIAADIISTVEFNHDGEFLATGDKGGRVVIFQRDGTKVGCTAPFVKKTGLFYRVVSNAICDRC